MTKSTKKSSETHDFESWARNTDLFRTWEETKKDVLLHKWYESEKAGRDIGWEKAFVDWMCRIRKKSHLPKSP